MVFLNLIKDIDEKPTANGNRESLHTVPIRSEITWDAHTHHSYTPPTPVKWVKKTEIRGLQTANADRKLLLVPGNTAIYIEHNKESKNISKTEFSKVSTYEVNIKMNFT